LLLVLFSCGTVGNALALSPFPRARRRADLSGVFRIPDRSLPVVPADAARPVEEGMGSVGIDVDLDPRLDEVRTQRAFGDLQFERAVGHAIVVAHLALLLDAQDLVEIDARDRRDPGEPDPRVKPEDGPARSGTRARSARAPVANRPQYARRRAARARGPLASAGCDRSCRPSRRCGSNAPPGPYRGSSAARARRMSR